MWRSCNFLCAKNIANLLTVGDLHCSAFTEAWVCWMMTHNGIIPLLRQLLFRYLISFGEYLSWYCNPFQLWEEHKTSLVEKHMPDNEAMQCGLRDLNSLLTQADQSLMYYNIPMWDMKMSEYKALEYDKFIRQQFWVNAQCTRRQIANAVFNSVTSPNDFNSSLFYLDGPQGYATELSKDSKASNHLVK